MPVYNHNIPCINISQCLCLKLHYKNASFPMATWLCHEDIYHISHKTSPSPKMRETLFSEFESLFRDVSAPRQVFFTCLGFPHCQHTTFILWFLFPCVPLLTTIIEFVVMFSLLFILLSSQRILLAISSKLNVSLPYIKTSLISL